MVTSWTAGYDNLKPPQNNGTLCYRVVDGQWFWIPHVSVTCFETWRTRDDQNELYRGDYINTVLQEDVTESINEKTGEANQIGANPVGTPNGIHDPDAEWVIDEWIGAIMYLQRVQDDTVEYATVYSNTADTLTGEAGSFNGADNAWTGDNPSQYDYYTIIKTIKTNDTIQIRYVMPKLTLDSVKRFKQFLKILINVFATNDITVSWTVDKVKSGTMVFEPTQGATFWGTHKWGDDVESDTLLWTDIDDMMFEQNLPFDAKGRYIEFTLELQTAQEFELSLFAMGYLIHGGTGWRS